MQQGAVVPLSPGDFLAQSDKILCVLHWDIREDAVAEVEDVAAVFHHFSDGFNRFLGGFLGVESGGFHIAL